MVRYLWASAAALVIIGMAGLLLWSSDTGASPRDITTEDRLAILYAPQFNFTRNGEPLIHAGVLKRVEEATFSSDGPIRVLPLGDGGPELTLAKSRQHKVSIEDGRPGKYRHWVVVQRVQYGSNAERDRVIDKWVKRGYLPKAFEVGGLFAIGGRRFDSRTVLVTVGGFEDRKEALQLSDRLEARFGVETEMHSELLRYPGGKLVLTGRQLPGKMVHRDILWIAPTKPGQTFRLSTPDGERIYAGSLVFTADDKGKLSVVNAVPAETLLKGVVPSEVYPSASMEALKAQAVAARGELLSAVGVRHLADPFLLCSDVHCQVYSGLTREHPRTNKAVEATRGQLMFPKNDDGHVVDARYSASCGGHSESNQNVWGGEAIPYLQGHADGDVGIGHPHDKGVSSAHMREWLSSDYRAWCNTSSFGGNRTYRWNKTVPVKTLQQYLDRHFDIGRLQDVAIRQRGRSGRVIRMDVIGDRGETTLDRELAIRRAFGGLRSSMFTMEVSRDNDNQPQKFSFSGGGFGHGVGMCQTGAMMMAESGRSYTDILTHYYPGVRIQKLY